MKINTDSAVQHERMMKTPIPKLVISLAVPSVISQLISVIYNTADTYFVSQISTSASAAVGAALALMSIIHAFGFGIGMGCGSLISRKLGEKDDASAERYAISAFVLAFAVGAVIGSLGLFFTEPLMKLLGSTDTMLPHSVAYAKYILMAAPIMCSAFVLNNILRSEGESMLAMIGISSGGILNVVLDPILIYNLNMGTAGAALATAISQTVSFLVLLSFFLLKKSIVRLRFASIGKRFYDYYIIVATGFPTICRQGVASIAAALLNNTALPYGDAAVAAITVSNRVYTLVRNIVLGIGQGFQPVAGYNYGAGNKKRTAKAFWFACIVGTGICIVCSGVIAIFPTHIVGWFRNDPQVIEIGAKALLYCCAVMPFMAYSTYVNQLYQCLGFKWQASVLAMCRQGICFVPIVLLFAKYLGLFGVSISQPASDLATFFISVPFQIWFMKKVLAEKRVKTL